jgi:CheY-like chemotaxis protein
MKAKSILFVEDNLEILENTLEILELNGFRAIGAYSGVEGMELAIKHRPDLVISDIQIPKMDGYGLLEKLRQHPQTARIPFIFLSASAQREDIEKGRISGADAYLVKPVSADDLLSAINNILTA